jgi:hypothetical protein
VRLGVAGRRSIADLIWVANTRHGPGGHWFARVTRDDGDHDHLRTPEETARYLAEHGVDIPADPPEPSDLADLAAIREMVRGLRDASGGWTEPVLEILARGRYNLTADGSIGAAGSPWAAFVGDMLLPLLEVVRLRQRLLICGNPHCRLVFIDASKSGTRRWCDDAGCGNRNRVRRHRAASVGAPSTMLP